MGNEIHLLVHQSTFLSSCLSHCLHLHLHTILYTCLSNLHHEEKPHTSPQALLKLGFHLQASVSSKESCIDVS